VRRVSKLHNFLIEIDPCREFLAPGAPCEINIDGKTMEKVHQEMKTPSRFTFDAAQEHVYTLLLKKIVTLDLLGQSIIKIFWRLAYSLLRKSGKFSLKKKSMHHCFIPRISRHVYIIL
jgi:hypothetical protein